MSYRKKYLGTYVQNSLSQKFVSLCKNLAGQKPSNNFYINLHKRSHNFKFNYMP